MRSQTVASSFHPAEDSSATAAIVVPILMERFSPASILDIGCNVGMWGAEFHARGISVIGVDGPGMAADIEHDLREPLELLRKFDMVLCLEVAEHIASWYADVLVESCIRHAGRTIVWSAATPGQGGFNHVNEQPHEYWVQKFAARGWRGESMTGSLPVLPHDYYRKNMWAFQQ